MNDVGILHNPRSLSCDHGLHCSHDLTHATRGGFLSEIVWGRTVVFRDITTSFFF